MKHEGIMIAVFFVFVLVMPAVVVFRAWGTAFSGIKRAKSSSPESPAGNSESASDNEAKPAIQEAGQPENNTGN